MEEIMEVVADGHPPKYWDPDLPWAAVIWKPSQHLDFWEDHVEKPCSCFTTHASKPAFLGQPPHVEHMLLQHLAVQLQRPVPKEAALRGNVDQAPPSQQGGRAERARLVERMIHHTRDGVSICVAR